MAAQVLHGSGNVTYTNSTGQNVRLVINFLELPNVGGDTTVSFPGTSLVATRNAMYGKTLGYRSRISGEAGLVASMAAHNPGHGVQEINPIPLEIALANGETFSITGNTSANVGGYNIIIIPEAG